MDVDLTVTKGLEHMSGDLLAVVKIHTGNADQGDIRVMNDRFTTDLFMDLLGNFQCPIEIFFPDTDKDVIIFVAIKKIHD